jgi:hypothetical protein
MTSFFLEIPEGRNSATIANTIRTMYLRVRHVVCSQKVVFVESFEADLREKWLVAQKKKKDKQQKKLKKKGFPLNYKTLVFFHFVFFFVKSDYERESIMGDFDHVTC